MTPMWPERNATSEWYGVRISMVGPDHPLYALGLRDRDLLRAINGIPIVDALVDPSVLSPVMNAKSLVLDIARQRLPRSLSYRIVP